MTKKVHAALDSYLRLLADDMGLRDWTVELLDEPADDDCNAQARIIYGRKRVQIRVSEQFADFDLERIRHSLVHELIHCHFVAADHMVEYDLRDHLGAQAADIFHAGYRRHAEYGVDGLADAFAPRLPLIELSKP